MLSSPLIGSAAFMALNYMWVVSAGRKLRQMSEREISGCERIVSEIGERGQDRDDRQATRSVATTSPPSNPTPHSGAIVCSSIGPVGLEGAVEASCSISLGNDEAVHLCQLQFPSKLQAPPHPHPSKKEIDIIHLNIFLPP